METIPKPHHDHHPLIFPQGFLWGAATAAHQVEGNNTHSDWFDWELKNQPPEKRSGKACDHYNRYAKDFTLAKDLGHNSHRLSIEWARIEPVEGQFNEAEIEHYRKVLKDLKDKNFTVMLTLWHFTLPKWLAEKQGFENRQTVKYFERFVAKIVPELKEYVDLWITINEPSVYALMAYLQGIWPPQKKSFISAAKVLWNISSAHKSAYKIIHQHVPNAKVGIAQNIASFEAFHKHSLREVLAEYFLDIFYNQLFYKFTGIKHHDFLGLNYYFNNYISFNGEKSRLPSLVDIQTTQKEVTDMGWEIFPQGMFDILMDFSDYHLPIYITENGLASTNDDRRCRFLIGYLQEIYHAIQAGALVQGYFHWSLMDNFEWADGFKPRFGLIEIDYQTEQRTPRPSAYVYMDVIKNNAIPHTLLRFLGHTVNAEEVLRRDHGLEQVVEQEIQEIPNVMTKLPYDDYTLSAISPLLLDN